MRRGSVWARAALMVAAALFGTGVVQLLRMRFTAGDVYLPYSSFRADPVGTRALFDSLALLPGMEVRRSTVPPGDLAACDCMVAFLGVNADGTAALVDDAERLARGGARVVVALLPEWPDLAARPERKDRYRGSLFEQTGVQVARRKLDEKEVIGTGLPRETAISFEGLGDGWSARRKQAGRAVAIERRWHSGSLVLIADSWPLSNDALAQRPDAVELSWMIGGKAAVIFDEAHLGTQDRGSIAGLIRHLKLHGVLAAVIGLAALFVWSRAYPLLPSAEEQARASAEGRASAVGLIGLLHRSVAPGDLIGVCMQEWRSGGAAQSGKAREAVERAVADLDDTNDAVRAYQQVHRNIKGVIRS